jgi:hypothetical protein
LHGVEQPDLTDPPPPASSTSSSASLTIFKDGATALAKCANTPLSMKDRNLRVWHTTGQWRKSVCLVPVTNLNLLAIMLEMKHTLFSFF